VVDGKGVFRADTRYQLPTDDGADIFVRTAGPAQADGRIHLAVRLETSSAAYYWVNSIVAVAVRT
ncbi:hypothetical protein B0T26DRAFT_599236, partial [Lasiosphaeria miniovina]